LLIKGENIEVLKHLSNAYYEKIKMIYIDPPYNTGSDGFVYQDDRAFTVEELREFAGIDEQRAKRILDFTASKSNSHSAWLTFMYPRLYIAKQLLAEDGIIFVSIDDNEVAQLKILMDEVFGEENLIGILSVENNPKGRKNSNFISVSNEFCLIYAKNSNIAEFNKTIPKESSDMELDENGNYIRKSGKRVLVGENFLNPFVENIASDKHYSVYFNNEKQDLITKKEKEIEDIDNELLKKGYIRYVTFRENKFVNNTYTENKFLILFNEGKLNIKNEKIYERYFSDGMRIKSMLVNKKYKAIINNLKTTYELDLKSTSAKQKLVTLMGAEVFSFPKNTSFIKTLLRLNVLSFDNDTVIDFFAGSGTTADAVMQLNAEDGGNRKFIMVQLDEPIDAKKVKLPMILLKMN
jgi:adenine specific DNA methylase Mod